MKNHAVDHYTAAAHRSGNLHRVAGQLGVWVLRHRTGQEPASAQIQHGGEKELALTGENLGDVLCRPPKYADGFSNGVLL